MIVNKIAAHSAGKLSNEDKWHSYDNGKAPEMEMKEELDSLSEDYTWEWMNLPQGRKPIDNCWVNKIEITAENNMQHFIANLVDERFSQKV